MKDSIKAMVDKFLSWKLPNDFHPDAGISFRVDYNENTQWPMKHEPLGTNLFHAEQAMQMFEYCCAEELTKREAAAKQAGRDELLKELSEMEPYCWTVFDHSDGQTHYSSVRPLIVRPTYEKG